jgi:hypothetical protein
VQQRACLHAGVMSILECSARTGWEATLSSGVTRSELIEWMRSQAFAVVSTTHGDGRPQAAVVGIAVTDVLELVFDTLTTSRKSENLRRGDGRCAVVAWRDSATVQLEGIADEPTGDERARLVAHYLAAFPEGRARAERAPIAYFRIRPTWVRWSDFATEPPRIEEL